MEEEEEDVIDKEEEDDTVVEEEDLTGAVAIDEELRDAGVVVALGVLE